MSKYRREIDGLRAIAVVAVVVYHAGFSFLGRPLLPGGLLGVDIFFVISGYLIGSVVIAEVREGQFSLSNFYERRARRILPALFFVVAITMAVGWAALLPAAMIELAESALATVTFWSNFYFWTKGGYDAAASELRPLLHTWSLAIEEQFYLLMPIAVMLFGLRWHRYGIWLVLLSALASIGLAEFSGRSPSFSFYMPFTRAWELLVGVVLADLQLRFGRRQPSGLLVTIGLALIVFSMLALDGTRRHPGIFTLPTIIGTATIIWYGGGRDIGTKLLSSKPFVGIGLISYSLYLFHQPIFAFARLTSVDSLGVPSLLILAAASFLSGWASWWCVERPFRNSTIVSTKAIWSFTLCSTLMIGCISGILVTNRAFPERFPAIFAAAEPEAEWWRLTNDGEPCHDNYRFNPCHFDLQGNEGAWILVGDSHAGAIAPSLLEGLAAESSSLDVLIWGGCPVIFDVDYIEPPVNGHISCGDRNDKVRDFLLSSPPSTVVYLARMQLWLEGTRFDNGEGGVELGEVDILAPRMFAGDRQEALGAAVTSTIEQILDMGHGLVLVYPVPEVGWDVPRVLKSIMPSDAAQASEWMMESHLTTSFARYLDRTALARAAYDSIGERHGLVRVYPADIFCDGHRCHTYDANAFFYSDDDHLSAAGARRLVSRIIAAQEQR